MRVIDAPTKGRSMRILLLCSLAAAIVGTPAAAQHHSPYAGQEDRTVKALSAQEVADYLAGRGMGLAKALRWVEASGGSIRLESRLGTGTRTVLLLPAVQNATGGGPTGADAKPASERRAASS